MFDPVPMLLCETAAVVAAAAAAVAVGLIQPKAALVPHRTKYQRQMCSANMSTEMVLAGGNDADSDTA